MKNTIVLFCVFCGLASIDALAKPDKYQFTVLCDSPLGSKRDSGPEASRASSPEEAVARLNNILKTGHVNIRVVGENMNDSFSGDIRNLLSAPTIQSISENDKTSYIACVSLELMP